MARTGQRRSKIELQRKTETKNAYGEPVETWTTYSRPWAKVIGEYGTERIVGQQVTGRGVIVVNILHRFPEPEIAERVKFGDRTFDINDVDNPSQLNQELVLTCTEVTG